MIRPLLVALALLAAVPARAEVPESVDALERAFQKEYAWLVAEQDALRARLASFDADAERRISEAEARLDAVQARLLAVRREADAAEERLAQAERARVSATEGRGALDAALEQAVATLGLEPAPPNVAAEEVARRLGDAFEAAAARLRTFASIRSEAATFFGPDGEQLRGTVLRVGGIAAYGVADGAAGALMPAGGGALQVYGPVATDGDARALLAGSPPPAIGVFLYESEDQRAEPPAVKTFGDLVEAGGAVGLVILGLGGVLIVLAGWRAVVLVRASGGSEQAVAEVAEALRAGRPEQARALAARLRGSTGRVLRAVVASPDLDREELEAIAEREIEREATALERFGTAVSVGAAVAPLLGLLGTVSGMIATFDVITEYGAGNPKLLSGGISEALVTTEFGLVVAIPGVLVGNLLAARARETLAATERAALLVMHHAERTGLRVVEGGVVDEAAAEEAAHG